MGEKIRKVLEKILGSNKYALDAVAYFNPQLRIIACKTDSLDKKNWALYKIWERIVSASGDDNRKLQEINSQTRYIHGRTGRLKGMILEYFGGYQRI